MDTRFLGSLIEIVDTGSIAEAARNQGLTPAALSQRIKALESSLDCQLLSRAGHSAKPTSACLRILPRLRQVVTDIAALRGDLDESGLSGELRIGAISTALTGILPGTIHHLSSMAPNLSLKIVPGTSADLYKQLNNQKIDIALLVSPPFSCPKYLQQTALYCEELGLISPRTNTLGIKETLQTYPLIQYDRKAWGGRLADAFLQDRGITVKPLCEIDALESIALMVKLGMGVSLTPLWKGIEAVAEDLKLVPIRDKKYQRTLSLLSHRQSGREPLIRVFSEAVTRSSGA